MSYKQIDAIRNSFTLLSTNNPFRRSTSIDINNTDSSSNDLFFYNSSNVSKKIDTFTTSSNALKDSFMALLKSQYQDQKITDECDSKFSHLKKLKNDIVGEIEALKTTLDLDSDNENFQKINLINRLIFNFKNAIIEAIKNFKLVDAAVVKFTMDTYPITTDELLKGLTASADQTQYSTLLEQFESEDDKQQLTSINFICMDRMKMLAVMHDFNKVKEKLQSVTTKPPGYTKSKAAGGASGAATVAFASPSVPPLSRPVSANVTISTSSLDLEKGSTSGAMGGGVQFKDLDGGSGYGMGRDGLYQRDPQQGGNKSKFVWTKRRILMLSVVIFVILVFVIFGIAYKVKTDNDKQHKKNADVATISVSNLVSSTTGSTSSSSATKTSSVSITSTTGSSSESTTAGSSSTSSASSSSQTTTTSTESSSSNTSTTSQSSTEFTTSQTSTSTSETSQSSTETPSTSETSIVTYSNPDGSWQTLTDSQGSVYATWISTKGGTWLYTKTSGGKNAMLTATASTETGIETAMGNAKDVVHAVSTVTTSKGHHGVGVVFARPTRTLG
ncbi:unnamed protein product [Ambrosiozyma monospora]|uniref:Unnamed protein product n=1 Tax=Ambrosiozyma monospora TaxID=43982 RepID=A0ACB5SWW5_AMBMO|nr:unnamed protein product [Ambrosiozyma monospora]